MQESDEQLSARIMKFNDKDLRDSLMLLDMNGIAAVVRNDYRASSRRLFYLMDLRLGSIRTLCRTHPHARQAKWWPEFTAKLQATVGPWISSRKDDSAAWRQVSDTWAHFVEKYIESNEQK